MAAITLLRVAVLLLGAAFGAALGSFAGLALDRLPRRGSFLRPRSTCTACETPIPMYDNIPIISWLTLRGCCRRCEAPIPASLFALEVVGASLGALIAIRF